MSAKLTHDTETFGKMDPYCKVSLGGELKKTKTHQEAGKYPTWNDSFTFQRNSENFLNIEVWDEDTVSADDLVGETSIALGDTFEKKKTQNWHVLSYKGKEAGKILVSLEFVPDAARQPAQTSLPTMNYSYNPNTVPMMGSPPVYGYGAYPGMMPPPYGQQPAGGPYQGLPRAPTVQQPPMYGTQYPVQYGYPPQGGQFQSQAPPQYPHQYQQPPPGQYQQPPAQYQPSAPQFQQSQPPPQYQGYPPQGPGYQQPPPQGPGYQQPPPQGGYQQPPPQNQGPPPQGNYQQPPPQNQGPPPQGNYQQQPAGSYIQPPQGPSQQGYQQPPPQNQAPGGYGYGMTQTINIPDNSDPNKQFPRQPTVQQPGYEQNIPKAQQFPPQQGGGGYDYPKFG